MPASLEPKKLNQAFARFFFAAFLGAGLFLTVFFFADFAGFELFAFLEGLLTLGTASEEAVASRCAVFASLPTADPTPRAIVFIRSLELVAFLGMISPVDRCTALV
jgi:hypothetical protein